MAEKKLSEELKECMNCGCCKHCEIPNKEEYEYETTRICKGLLQKAYERIKEYEEMEEQEEWRD